MTEVKTYHSPEAFKQALEARLRQAANMNRARQVLVMERFYARVAAVMGEAVVVKGGMVLERRLDRARTTKDLDLRLAGDPDALLASLQEAGRLPLGDFMTFMVEPDPTHATIDGDGMVYEGRRFRVTPFMASKIYGAAFGVDAGFGDPLWGDVELFEGADTLDFCGAPRASWRMYPRHTHLAEKLHAYTMPRERENSRVKDLPDMALLATTGAYDARELLEAFKVTFRFRNTHQLPSAVPNPPASWAAPYARMAREDQLKWTTIDELLEAVRAFIDPILAGRPGRWEPEIWAWVESET